MLVGLLASLPGGLAQAWPVMISGDIYQNQIWLLRKNKVSVSQVPSGLPGTFRDVFVSGQGVWGPQDVQPLSKESKYKALLK